MNNKNKHPVWLKKDIESQKKFDQLKEKASPGPWNVLSLVSGGYGSYVHYGNECKTSTNICACMKTAPELQGENSVFICAARNDDQGERYWRLLDAYIELKKGKQNDQ